MLLIRTALMEIGAQSFAEKSQPLRLFHHWTYTRWTHTPVREKYTTRCSESTTAPKVVSEILVVNEITLLIQVK